MTIDGKQVVLLALVDFYRLDAARRQVGASTAQAIQLRQQLRDARRRLDRLERLAASAPSDPSPVDSCSCRCRRADDDGPDDTRVPQGRLAHADQDAEGPAVGDDGGGPRLR
ncbi:hypothetical protein ACWDXH_28215 [Micromonospora chokoriensis]